jgi:hypothetical protein
MDENWKNPIKPNKTQKKPIKPYKTHRAGFFKKKTGFLPTLTPPLKKYINLKGLPNNNLRSKIDHISANSKQNSKRI